MKLAGRVGDTPLPGAGTYTTTHAAISATGTGEYVVRTLAARQIADDVARGLSLQVAFEKMLAELGREFDADVGFIGIDANGNAIAAHRTPHMPHAWFSGESDIVTRMHCERA